MAGALSSFTAVRNGTAAGIERPAGRSDATGRAGWFPERARAAARASGDAGATMAPGIGAFFPVGTFASLTGAGGGGGTSATTGAGSAGAPTSEVTTTGAALAFAADAFVALTSSAEATPSGTAFAAGSLAVTGAVLAVTGAVLTGAALAGTGVAGIAFAVAFGEVGTPLAGATFAGTTLAGATFAGAAFAEATLARAAAGFAGAGFGAALGTGLALALTGGATTLADAACFAMVLVALLGVVGDFMVVRGADRVGGGAGFALVTLAVERFTGAGVFAGAALVALVTSLVVVFFAEVVVVALALDTVGFGVALVLALLGVALVTTALREMAFPDAGFAEVTETPAFLPVALEGVDFGELAFDPLAFGAGLPDDFTAVVLAACFSGAFVAPADFAEVRAGIDFDVVATMYSRYGAGGTARSPGRRADYCLNQPKTRHCARETGSST